MRKETAVKRPLGRLRLPDEVVTVFVPCAMGPNGRHPVSLGLEEIPNEGRAIVHMGCGCTKGAHAEAVKRLGGESCLTMLEALRAVYFKPEQKDRVRVSASLTSGVYYIRNRIEAVRNGRQKPKMKKPTQQELLEAVASKVATKAAGIPMTVKVGGKPNGVGITPERRLVFGSETVSERFGGCWVLNEVEMQETARNGRTSLVSDKHRCLVCNKEFVRDSGLEHHTSSRKHAELVVERFKLAIRALNRVHWNTQKKEERR